jgi:hypothetical protein
VPAPLPRFIHARTIALQCQLSLERGVTGQELQQLGLGLAALDEPDAVVPGEAVHAHLELTASRTPFEPFAIELARRHRPSSLGLVGFLIKTAASVPQGIARFDRWQHLTSTLAEVDLLEGPRGLLWVERRHGPASLGSQLATEVSATTTIQILREMIGADVTPLRVSLRRLDLERIAYKSFFGCPVEAGAERGQILLPAAILGRPVATADPEMGAWFERVAAEKAREMEAQSPLRGQLRRLLAGTLQEGALPLDQAARRLALRA